MSLGLLSPVPRQRQFTDLGVVSPGAKLYTFLTASATPQPVYTSDALTVEHANPLVASSGGLLPAFWLANGISYRMRLDDSLGNVLWGPIDGVATGSAPGNVDVDVIAVAGENLAIGDVVYLSDGSGALTAGRWYKTDADFVYASSGAAVVGVVQVAITSGATGLVKLTGRVTGLVGLVVGTDYYVSDTAGALTATSTLSNSRLVGRADTTTSLVLDPGPVGPGGMDIIQIEALLI
jgi:hypothetical protein